MLREKSATLVQIGVALIVAGMAVYLALAVGRFLAPIAGLAIFAGIVLAIIGLVTPGRKQF